MSKKESVDAASMHPIVMRLLKDHAIDAAFTEYEKFIARVINTPLFGVAKLKKDIAKERAALLDAVAKSVSAGPSLQEFVDWCDKEHAEELARHAHEDSEDASHWYIAKRLADALTVVRLFRAE